MLNGWLVGLPSWAYLHTCLRRVCGHHLSLCQTMCQLSLTHSLLHIYLRHRQNRPILFQWSLASLPRWNPSLLLRSLSKDFDDYLLIFWPPLPCCPYCSTPYPASLFHPLDVTEPFTFLKLVMVPFTLLASLTIIFPFISLRDANWASPPMTIAIDEAFDFIFLKKLFYMSKELKRLATLKDCVWLQ